MVCIVPFAFKQDEAFMVYVKFAPEISSLQFHCNFTAISLADFGFREIRQLKSPTDQVKPPVP